MAQDEKYPFALPQGTILAGQYVIEQTLGQGGFGITYRATDHKTGQRVAVKEFFPDSMAARTTATEVSPFSGARGESFVYGKECFLQEAETLAKFIGNEHIVRVYSYFEENGTAYFVMEYVEGTSFDRYIKERGGKVSYEEAEKILLPVIDALAVVHAKGIVHRDVTPDNIYITKDGTVKLLDFGAARYSLGDKSRSLDVVLKHGFAPKEQYTRHGRQGAFTDVYTVGASFYFAITGKRPPDSIDRMDEDELIPPSSLVRIPPEKEDAILTAMSVQPANRYQTMVDFREALMRAPEEEMQNVEAQAAAAVPLQGAAAAQEVPLQPVQQKVFAAPQSAQPEAEAKPVQQISQSVPQPVYIQQQPNVQQEPASAPQNVGVQPIQQPEPVQEAKNKEQQPTPVQQTAQQPSGKGTKIIAVLGILGSIVFEAMPRDFIFFRNCPFPIYTLLHFLIGIALMLTGIYAVFRLVEKQNVVSKKDRNVRIALCGSWVAAIRGYRGFTFLTFYEYYGWIRIAMATVAVLALIVAVVSFVIIMADKKKNGKMPQGDKDRTIAQINEVTAMLVALEGLYHIYLLRYDCYAYAFGPFLILSVLLPVLILASIYIAFVSMEKQIGMRNNEKRKYRIAQIVLCELVVVSLEGWIYQLETVELVAYTFFYRVWGNWFNWYGWCFWYWENLQYVNDYCNSIVRSICWFYAVLSFLVIATIAAVSLCILKNGRKKDGEIPQESEKETALIRRTAIFVAEEGMLMFVVVFLSGGVRYLLSGWELYLNSAYLLYGIFLMLVGISVAHGCSKKCDDRYKKESKRYRSARLVLCESVPFAVVFATMRDGYSPYAPGVLMKLTVISPIVMIAMISLIVMITNRNKSTT